MNRSRREFLQTSAVAASLVGIGSAPGRLTTPQTAPDPTITPRNEPKLKILILGGTRFLGPALVEAAQAHGHELTLFNRGRSNPNLFPEIEKLKGNRDPKIDEGLASLEGRTWDAVVDTSGYITRHVRASAELLADAVRQYVFISTISVYADPSRPDIDEASAVGTLADDSLEDLNNDTYGPLKALCEKAAETAMPGRVTNIRPGLIVGPRDATDRFSYWPVRIARGGEVLAPGAGNDPVQIIDVRDLANFAIHCIEQRHTGVFNATGPGCTLTMAEMLHGCRAVTSACVSFTWVASDFLAKQNVTPWMDMPVWVPSDDESAGFGTISNTRGMEAGMTFRPFADTARDTRDWFRTLPVERQVDMRVGIKPDRESEVLQAWHENKET